MAIQFPNSPGIGSVFTDTDSGFSYEWTGVVWKSFTAAAASNIKTLDDISSSFNNSTTAFNLTIAGASYTPQNAAMLQISLGGVIQEPGTDYNVSFDTITFTTAPSAGLDFFGVVRATATKIDFANDGNVQTKQEFTATLGQTSFTVTGGYTQGYVDVFRNGVRLASDDFTDTSETAIVLTVPAQADDLIEVVKYNVASLVVSQGQFANLNISGVTTVGVITGATSIQSGVFYGPLTGNVTGDVTGNVTGTADLASGLTGTPNITVGSVAASSGTFSGNVTIGGTLTYTDVTNIDSVGIITAQQGLQVLANGVDVTGIGTFEDRITYDGSLGQSGGAQVDYAVTVASKDSTHRYNGSGSSNGYVIDNLQAPVLTLTPGRTYFFDQSDSSNASHPLRFYFDAAKVTQYTTNVTAGSISAGNAGAGVTIVVGDSTPNVLHYQCSSHAYMGNSLINQSNISGGAIGDFTIDDKIIHTGDTNTAIRFPANDTFTVETSGSERLRIDSSGNIGLGTPVPGTLVHLKGSAPKITLQHTATGSQGVLRWIDSDATVKSQIASYLNVADSGNIEFCTGGTSTVMEIDSSGRLLLGTTTEGNGGADQFTISTSEHTGMTLRSGTTHQGNIFFSDGTSGDDEFRGIIRYDHNDNSMQLRTNAVEAARFDSSQRFLIGATSAITAPDDKVQINSSTGIGIHRGEAGTAGPRIDLTKSRNATHGSNTIVQSGDLLGSIFFRGDDGTDYNSPGAQILCQVDGTPGSNDMPGRLVFSTTADGSASPTERLRITAGGGFHFTNGELIEQANVTAGKLSDNTNIDLENGMVHLFTTTETTTSTPNIRINSSTSLNSVMAIGETISVTLITTAAAAGYSAQLTIDGGAVTENWTGGSAPSDGGSSGVDIYAYTIIKTADATFTVVATQTKTS